MATLNPLLKTTRQPAKYSAILNSAFSPFCHLFLYSKALEFSALVRLLLALFPKLLRLVHLLLGESELNPLALQPPMLQREYFRYETLPNLTKCVLNVRHH